MRNLDGNFLKSGVVPLISIPVVSTSWNSRKNGAKKKLMSKYFESFFLNHKSSKKSIPVIWGLMTDLTWLVLTWSNSTKKGEKKKSQVEKFWIFFLKS